MPTLNRQVPQASASTDDSVDLRYGDSVSVWETGIGVEESMFRDVRGERLFSGVGIGTARSG